MFTTMCIGNMTGLVAKSLCPIPIKPFASDAIYFIAMTLAQVQWGNFQINYVWDKFLSGPTIKKCPKNLSHHVIYLKITSLPLR